MTLAEFAIARAFEQRCRQELLTPKEKENLEVLRAAVKKYAELDAARRRG